MNIAKDWPEMQGRDMTTLEAAEIEARTLAGLKDKALRDKTKVSIQQRHSPQMARYIILMAKDIYYGKVK